MSKQKERGRQKPCFSSLRRVGDLYIATHPVAVHEVDRVVRCEKQLTFFLILFYYQCSMHDSKMKNRTIPSEILL